MKLYFNTEALLADSLKELSDIIKNILEKMADDSKSESSQYDDFAKEFYNIAVLIDIINNKRLTKFFDSLMEELYKSKGSLDCCKEEIEILYSNVVNFENI